MFGLRVRLGVRVRPSLTPSLFQKSSACINAMPVVKRKRLLAARRKLSVARKRIPLLVGLGFVFGLGLGLGLGLGPV